MRAWFALVNLAILVSGLLSSPIRAQEVEKPLPEFASFVAEVKSRLHMNQSLLKNYTYQQRNIQKHLDKNGRVKKVETSLYEIFPDADPELTYRRLVEKDGKRVPERELTKQLRDYEKRRAKKDKKRLESDAKADEKAKNEEREAIDEAFRLFEIVMEGREMIDGRPTIRFSFKPKPGVKAKSSEGKTLLKFAGHAWFDEAFYEMVRVEAEAIKDVSFGFGLLAKLHKGSKGLFERRLFNNEVWLPSTTRFSGSLRLMLVKGMRMEVTDQYFDYRKFSVETSVSYDKE